jgi:hypothetical protein
MHGVKYICIILVSYYFSFTIYSNGQIVVIGGVALVTNNGTTDSILAPMNQIYVFDTKTNQWDLKTATGQGGTLPSTRTAHLAVVSKLYFRL